MKKILALMIVSSLMGASAMAKVGETKEVNCKDVVKKIREAQDKRPGSNGASADDASPAVKGNEKDAK